MTDVIGQTPTSSDCQQYYQELYRQCGQVLSASFQADQRGLQSRSHSLAHDLEEWIGTLSTRPEAAILSAALREYRFALLSVVLGQYRQAFMGLRLFLELALAAVHFSATEIELRIWLRGERDIYWSAIVDPEGGVFSRRFVTAFWDELAPEALHYGALAEKAYRECSEYVHGSAQTQETLPETLRFAEDVFLDWHERADNVRLAVSFALCARYLPSLDQDSLKRLEQVVMDEMGHVPTIRAFLGGTAEEDDA